MANIGGIGILKQAKSPQLAWEFIQWFISPDIMAWATTQRMTLPSRMDIYEQQLSKQPKYISSLYDVLLYVYPSTVGKVNVPAALNWAEFETLLHQIYEGRASADRLLALGAAWQKQANEVWLKSGVR